MVESTIENPYFAQVDLARTSTFMQHDVRARAAAQDSLALERLPLLCRDGTDSQFDEFASKRTAPGIEVERKFSITTIGEAMRAASRVQPDLGSRR